MSDHIATTKIETTSGTREVPVFDPSDLEEPGWFRVETPAGTGAVRLVDLSDATLDEYRAQTPDGLKAVATTLPGAIPDSESNQKLVHRWTLSEQSPPFEDSVGSAASTSVTGTTRVPGDWIDGAARSSDGEDDQATTTAWGSFGSNLKGSWAIAFSVADISSNGAILGVRNSNDGQLMVLSTNGTGVSGLGSDHVSLAVRETDGDTNSCQGSTDLTSGGPYRAVVNVVDGTDPGTWEVYVNQGQDEGIEQTGQYDGQAMGDFDTPVSMFSWNDAGSISGRITSTLDDVCVFGDSLTTTEAQSYTNPW